MLLAWEFFFSGFHPPKNSEKHIYYTYGPDIFIKKKLTGAFFVFVSKSTFEVLTPPVWLMGGAQKISRLDLINPFLISRMSPSFEKFYAERRKIRIFFKNILVDTVYEGWGHTHFRKTSSLFLVSIPIWAFWLPAENQVIRPVVIIQSYPAKAFVIMNSHHPTKFRRPTNRSYAIIEHEWHFFLLYTSSSFFHVWVLKCYPSTRWTWKFPEVLLL